MSARSPPRVGVPRRTGPPRRRTGSDAPRPRPPGARAGPRRSATTPSAPRATLPRARAAGCGPVADRRGAPSRAIPTADARTPTVASPPSDARSSSAARRGGAAPRPPRRANAEPPFRPRPPKTRAEERSCRTRNAAGDATAPTPPQYSPAGAGSNRRVRTARARYRVARRRTGPASRFAHIAAADPRRRVPQPKQPIAECATLLLLEHIAKQRLEHRGVSIERVTHRTAGESTLACPGTTRRRHHLTLSTGRSAVGANHREPGQIGGIPTRIPHRTPEIRTASL